MTDEILKLNISSLLKAIDGRATLLAATKTVDAETINKIYPLGVHTIGENRVNELMEKLPLLDKRFDIHFIGRLQKNKAKYIVGKVSLIHSLDSLPLAAEIEKQAEKHGVVQSCLVEVNLGGEDSKGGIAIDEIEPFLDEMTLFPHIKICGLMGVLPKSENKEKNIIFFTKLTQKFIDIGTHYVDNNNKDNIVMNVLSMGMSDDYAQALDCGSNLVRIGTGIFGERK